MSWLKQNAGHAHARQVGTMLVLWRSEAPYRLVMGLVLLLSMVSLFSFAKVWPLMFAWAAAETLLFRISLPYERTWFKISNQTSIIVHFLAITITFQYFLPSMLFVTSDSTTIQVVGMFWLLGASHYTANTYGSIPQFYWATYFPAGLTILIASNTIYTNDASTQNPIIYGFGIMFTLMYIVNTGIILLRQKSIQDALQYAQTAADDRMAELEFLSKSDRLTGLANRAYFDDRLEKMLDEPKRRLSGLAVILIDLDKFKPINDYFGHAAGDKVLQTIAKRLQTSLQKDGLIARLGGDEFALVLRNVTDKADALKKAKQIHAAIEKPIIYEDDALIVGASMGIAYSANGTETPADLCKSADQAMFSVKHDPDKSVALFDPKLFAARATLSDKIDLEKALNTGEIRPYYQPKYDMRTGKIAGFEALARWHHPTIGLRPPSDFIPKLEELNMMSQLTFLIMRKVLADIEKWCAMGYDPKSVSINVDETTLASVTGRQDLLWVLSERMDVLRYVTLEVTEDVVLARSGEFIRQSIEKITELGVRISLDDFGTGFASFQHLRQLVPDELKIDTSFVNTIGIEATSKVIIEGFISIAEGLDIAVVAEGVETNEQRDFLIKRGCSIGQGYLFSPAIPFESCCALLALDNQPFQDHKRTA